MKIVTKEEVIQELGAVPGELRFDFYVREVIGNDICFHPVLGAKA